MKLKDLQKLKQQIEVENFLTERNESIGWAKNTEVADEIKGLKEFAVVVKTERNVQHVGKCKFRKDRIWSDISSTWNASDWNLQPERSWSGSLDRRTKRIVSTR